MGNMNRRGFLKRSIAATGAFAIGGSGALGRVLGANDTVRVGVAGLNSRGESHLDAFAGMKGAQVVYLIDPDSTLFESRAKRVEGKGGNRPKAVQDFRRALDDRDLDAISIAAPNHWHSLMTILACQAGKDVYVEKPLSHNVREGRIAVETARKHNCIVQHGTQSRSSGKWARVAALIRTGKLGKLRVARGLCYKPRGTIGFKETSMPPATLDFNLWLGPATEEAYHANLVHYNWHWFWKFGNGDIGNQGVHEMDKARWCIPGATLPKSVLSLGGRFGYRDQGETPNTQIALFDYGETQLIFEVRGLPTDPLQGQKVGNIFHLEGGTIVDDNQFIPKGKDKPEPLPQIDVEIPSRPGGGEHFRNFIECVRSRKREDLSAEILEGHLSSALCHLANISYRLGETVPFQPRTKAFGDNKDAYEALERVEAHLGEKNSLKLDGLQYRLGRKLTIDPANESIPGDPEASKLLFGPYRAPFVVEDKVV